MSAPGEPSGILVVDKPAGPTSHDVVDRVRRVLGTRRAGHTGTLDPFATGVLPVCVGKATRLARFMVESEKEYVATVRLGFATTTDDFHGEPLGSPRVGGVSEEAIGVACGALRGTILQVPPAFSAKRVQGQRAYDLARRGVSYDRRAVRVTVYSLEVLALEGECLDLKVRCSAGTYVRAIARDLGEALGVGGHLTGLRRTRSGGFGVEDAVGWSELEGAAERMRPASDAVRHLPAITLGPDGLRAVRHGRDLDEGLVMAGLPASGDLPERVRVLTESGDLVALAVPRGRFALPGGPAMEPGFHPDVVLVD